ncbi:MAG TPA: hypothetical protein VF981_14705 [Gemmatimonadaceae bacterium]
MSDITPHDRIDALDAQDARLRATQRFRSNLAAGLLLDWLLTDVEATKPAYFSELESRFETGYDYAKMWREDGTFNGEVPIHTADGDDVEFWIELEELDLLHDQLFPYGSHDAPAFADGRALVVVILHTALETVFQDLKLHRDGYESVVAAVVRYLRLATSEPLYADLVELREARNVIAHSGGTVDKRYLERVRGTSKEFGEKLVVTIKDLSRFAAAARRAGDSLLALP